MMDLAKRFAMAELVAAQYEDFKDFAIDGMAFLGFPCTWMQEDIADFMATGPRLRMVMAQRGEAKSTLAALYAVWRIVHRPSTRVLIVSGGETQASEVAFLIIRLIMQWDILEYLRPDKSNGDRASVERFDVHYALKGLDKSPSVACVGVTANLPGKRADILIADDVETTKNGMTATSRAQLQHITKEFTSICTHGDILYLGTPQTKDSVYNTLPGRGFCLRIWPGRYPTPEEVEKYGSKLAPSIAQRIAADSTLQTGGGLDGTRGKSADPDRYSESALVEKELDKGPEDFSLQHMLDTSLADAIRQQLKLSDLLVAQFDIDLVPEVMSYQTGERNRVQLRPDFPVPQAVMYHPVIPPDVGYRRPTERMMYLDPAGGGRDEIGLAVSAAVGPYIHILDCYGLKGGLTDENAETICATVRELGVKFIKVESNMGHGLFEKTLYAELCKRGLQHVGVIGEYSTGQKERRIIDSLVSAMQRHRIVVHPRVLDNDAKYLLQHPEDRRSLYSLWHQISTITTDRQSLVQDDRVEVFAGAVRHWKEVLVLDEHKAAEQRRAAEAAQFIADPMGYGETGKTVSGTRAAVHRRRGRR